MPKEEVQQNEQEKHRKIKGHHDHAETVRIGRQVGNLEILRCKQSLEIVADILQDHRDGELFVFGIAAFLGFLDFSIGTHDRFFDLIPAAHILSGTPILLHEAEESRRGSILVDVDSITFDDFFELSIVQRLRGVGEALGPDRETEEPHREREKDKALPVESIFSTAGTLVIVFRFVVLHENWSG